MKKGFKALTAFIKRKRKLISIIVTIVSIFVFLLWLNNNAKTTNSSQEPELSSFEILRESDPGLADIYEIVARQDVELVVIDELRNTIQVYPVPSEDDTIFTSERPIIFIYPDAVEDELFNRLVFESGVEQKLEFKNNGGGSTNIWMWIIIFGIFFLTIRWVIKKRRTMSDGNGSGNNANNGGTTKSIAQEIKPENIETRFSDVAGIDEILVEIKEIEDFLKNPAKYKDQGARLPKGVLLYGPPGTGKTLIARALAGETGATFFSANGSEFVEIFVGSGAARIRDLFKRARKKIPSIIFIDEIDGVGSHRTQGVGSGGDTEKDSTLNALLAEMDGFDNKKGVIIVGATNMREKLDPALLRPGRFDRHIEVTAPDRRGRLAILHVHATNKKLFDEQDLEWLAGKTTGFSGADLENVLNEAAILVAREEKENITRDILQKALDKIISGIDRNILISREDKITVAYHEAGHTLVGYVLATIDPLESVTILPKTSSLGHTVFSPSEDKYLRRSDELLDMIAMSLGGRAAEHIGRFGPTTGSGDDIEKATGIVREMVYYYAMFPDIGPVNYLNKQNPHRQPEISEEQRAKLDSKISYIMERELEQARRILNRYFSGLKALVEALLVKETLTGKEVEEIFNGYNIKAASLKRNEEGELIF
ncbi:MAG: hypothetical protein A3F94_01290 [Candidatus Spechtbacteria bacterium RIFCSPLOWO2_12_FULL_38_22]|uniref:ATP-dependent zinc metalloprotease FtsH n=1 Tax=Candidatus Spechtbacteria bacterium RIFCSPLOWO2_12_FULL_38_22 TaxID=1802165 RepID=A0A1G2HH24_9BACT|nr:MAG: hypothetical protein A3E58_00950 [Candidatus Spechtbacteria bacterium RIFCSPHIGHO2_12_FULL_38_30]OGZ61802.1 MAG: hypothetical protein A3F94_01290 [Candidatus Spechtbacteria bacterium RIFCSPLOWO2_12_FULL_38_22]